MLKLVEQGEMGFDTFWNAYPRKAAKKDAAKAWAKLNPSPELVLTILEALKLQRQQESWLKANGAYIPYAATYIRGERWEDEVIGVKASDDPFRGAL